MTVVIATTAAFRYRDILSAGDSIPPELAQRTKASTDLEMAILAKAGFNTSGKLAGGAPGMNGDAFKVVASVYRKAGAALDESSAAINAHIQNLWSQGYQVYNREIEPQLLAHIRMLAGIGFMDEEHRPSYWAPKDHFEYTAKRYIAATKVLGGDVGRAKEQTDNLRQQAFSKAYTTSKNTSEAAMQKWVDLGFPKYGYGDQGEAGARFRRLANTYWQASTKLGESEGERETFLDTLREQAHDNFKSR